MRRPIAGIATTVLLPGGIAGVVGPGAGIARADPPGTPTWCPRQPMPRQDFGPPLTWDMSVCHQWHYRGAHVFPVEAPDPVQRGPLP
jgi:hypothetical protein